MFLHYDVNTKYLHGFPLISHQKKLAIGTEIHDFKVQERLIRFASIKINSLDNNYYWIVNFTVVCRMSQPTYLLGA